MHLCNSTSSHAAITGPKSIAVVVHASTEGPHGTRRCVHMGPIYRCRIGYADERAEPPSGEEGIYLHQVVVAIEMGHPQNELQLPRAYALIQLICGTEVQEGRHSSLDTMAFGEGIARLRLPDLQRPEAPESSQRTADGSRVGVLTLQSSVHISKMTVGTRTPAVRSRESRLPIIEQHLRGVQVARRGIEPSTPAFCRHCRMCINEYWSAR